MADSTNSSALFSFPGHIAPSYGLGYRSNWAATGGTKDADPGGGATNGWFKPGDTVRMEYDKSKNELQVLCNGTLMGVTTKVSSHRLFAVGHYSSHAFGIEMGSTD
eukprot:2130541-Prymnesium_polylepis.1